MTGEGFCTSTDTQVIKFQWHSEEKRNGLLVVFFYACRSAVHLRTSATDQNYTLHPLHFGYLLHEPIKPETSQLAPTWLLESQFLVMSVHMGCLFCSVQITREETLQPADRRSEASHPSVKPPRVILVPFCTGQRGRAWACWLHYAQAHT